MVHPLRNTVCQLLIKMKNTQHRESPLWCFSSRNRHLRRHKTRTQRLSWLLRVIANPTLDTRASSLVTQLTELPRKKRLVVVAGSNMTCRNVMLSKISHTHGHPCAAQVYGYETLGGARGIWKKEVKQNKTQPKKAEVDQWLSEAGRVEKLTGKTYKDALWSNKMSCALLGWCSCKGSICKSASDCNLTVCGLERMR